MGAFFLNYKLDFNDILRCFLYILIFYNLRRYFRYNYLNVLRKFIIWSTIIQIPFCLVQLLLPNYYFILMDFGQTSTLYRITGTLVDPNLFSYFLIVAFIFITFSLTITAKKNIIIFMLLAITLFYLVDMSGSRGGMILMGIAFIYVFIKKLRNKQRLITLFFTIVLLIFFVGNIEYQIKDASKKEMMTGFARFFSSGTKTARWSKASSEQRLSSIEDGIQLIRKDGFLVGPGSFYYESVWDSNFHQVKPHNFIVFLYSMFGLLSLYPIYILLWKTYLNSKGSSFNFFMYFILVFSLMLTVNLMFYPLTFLLIEIISFTKADRYFLTKSISPFEVKDKVCLGRV